MGTPPVIPKDTGCACATHEIRPNNKEKRSMHLKDPRRASLTYTRPHRSRPALLWLCATTLLAQQPTTIRVPVRLVSVPTLVLGSDGRVLHNLQPADFHLFDDDRPRPFTLDTSVSPVSVVIAVQ